MSSPAGESSSEARLVVDHSRCDGHNVCIGYIGDLLDIDERSIVWVRDDGKVPPELRDDAKAAVDACPECALSLTTASGTPEQQG